MKICFCAPLLDFSGYAVASRNLLKALHHTGADIVARPLVYDKRDGDDKFVPPEWMQTLLDKQLTDIDFLIQMTTLNVEAVPHPDVCNGIYFFFETDRIPPAWVANANKFDFVMVPAQSVATALLRSGVTKPIVLFHPPFDLDVYQESHTPLKIPGSEGRTVFYNICQLSTKKGVDALIRAYYAAFADIPDDVLLVLKTYIGMQDRSQDKEAVTSFINTIRKGCRIPIKKYPPVLPIVDILSDDEIQGLHKTGDVYVCSSRGAGYEIPPFEALAHNSTLISHNQSGLGDWVSNEIAMVYNCVSSTVYDMQHGDPSLYTGVERYFEPSTGEMASLMRSFHILKQYADDGTMSDHYTKEEYQEKWGQILTMRRQGRSLVEKLDYRNCADTIMVQLTAAFESWRETGAVKFDLEDKKAKVMSL